MRNSSRRYRMDGAAGQVKWYPWLRRDFARLVAGWQAGRGHHALLIQALPGMGEDALAYALGRYLLCQHPGVDKSCGQCRGCQLMQAGAHPDYYPLAPEKGKSVLGIDAIREVSEKLWQRARSGGAKVVWLADASLLTDAAVNALLKTLEEPPDNTWFFLACRDPARLPATLRSRCRIYHLAPPSESHALAWILGNVTVSRDQALSALRLSVGAPGTALSLLRGEGWGHRQQLSEAVATAARSSDWLSLLAALNHEQVAEHLYWLATLIMDALKTRHGAALTNLDALPLVNFLAGQFSEAVLRAIVHDLCQCREQLLNVTAASRELILADHLLRIEHYLQPDAALPVARL